MNKGIVFVNGSPNKDGNTVAMARSVLGDAQFDELDLVDFKVYALGQDFPDDQFDDVWNFMRSAGTIVIGTPVYWYDVSGLLKSVIDRAYDHVSDGDLAGKRLVFLIQGAAPTQLTIDGTRHLAERFAELFGMELAGFACGREEASELARTIAL